MVFDLIIFGFAAQPGPVVYGFHDSQHPFEKFRIGRLVDTRQILYKLFA